MALCAIGPDRRGVLAKPIAEPGNMNQTEVIMVDSRQEASGMELESKGADDSGVSEDAAEPASDSFARMRQCMSKNIELPDEIGNLSDDTAKEGIAPPGWDDEVDDFMSVKPDTPQSEKEKEKERKLLADSRNLAANVGNFGIFLILAVIVGYFIGQFLDDLFGTKPVMTVFWIVCGVAASIQELVRNIKTAAKLAKETTDHEKQEDEKPDKDGV